MMSKDFQEILGIAVLIAVVCGAVVTCNHYDVHSVCRRECVEAGEKYVDCKKLCD